MGHKLIGEPEAPVSAMEDYGLLAGASSYPGSMLKTLAVPAAVLSAYLALASCAAQSPPQPRGYPDGTRPVPAAQHSALEHYNLSVELAQKREYAGAMRHLEEALALRPDFPQAHYNMAVILDITDRDEEAVGHYEVALRAMPNSAQAHAGLGTIFLKRSDFRRAREHLKRASEIDPTYTIALNNLGIALKELGEYEEAERTYKMALRSNPNDPEMHLNFSNLLTDNLGRHEEALEHLLRALELKPDYAAAHNNLGNFYMARRGDYAKAREHYETALRLGHSQIAETHSNMGILLMERFKEYDGARQQFERAIGLKPDNPKYRYNLSRLLVTHPQGEQDFAKARKLLEEALEINPNYAIAHNNLGLLINLKFQEEREKAIEHLRRALELEPDNAQFKASLEQIQKQHNK